VTGPAPRETIVLLPPSSLPSHSRPEGVNRPVIDFQIKVCQEVCRQPDTVCACCPVIRADHLPVFPPSPAVPITAHTGPRRRLGSRILDRRSASSWVLTQCVCCADGWLAGAVTSLAGADTAMTESMAPASSGARPLLHTQPEPLQPELTSY
jgi:hypothetical protein